MKRRRRNPSAATMGISTGVLLALGAAGYFLFFKKKSSPSFSMTAAGMPPASAPVSYGLKLTPAQQADLNNTQAQIEMLSAAGEPIPASMSDHFNAILSGKT